jgi:hypothetical protein
MPELTQTLISAREKQHEQNKFFAAIQGINLDEPASDGKQRGQKEWEDLKSRVFSKGKAKDSDDITSLTGITAKQKGFGIGQGLEFSDGNKIKNPFG